AADRHKECAARYWRKMREVPPDSFARHSWRHDYNFHIGSTERKRFRCEVIEQRGNRCERCWHVSAYLELHHKHYHSLGSEQREDVELLCPKCHKGADEARCEEPCLIAKTARACSFPTLVRRALAQPSGPSDAADRSRRRSPEALLSIVG